MSSRLIKETAATESKELFFTLTPEQRLAIREKLLQALNSETVANVRNKIGDAIAEIAGQYTENGTGYPRVRTLHLVSDVRNRFR